MDNIMDTSQKADQAKKQAVGSLFGDTDDMIAIKIDINDIDEFTPMEILEFEKDSLGFYVSGHPLDDYRDTLDEINYTLSSQIDELADGSQALFIGKIEKITEKISKKGNKFAIANIMDLHGNIELMLFENRIKEIEENFDITKPIAFKVKITKDGDFTKMNILNINTLKDAKKTKVKIIKEEKPMEEVKSIPLVLVLNLMSDTKLINDLFSLVTKHQGGRSLSLRIKSKLADVVVESQYKVNDMIIDDAKELGIYVEEQLVEVG
jgi:DNA polymerase-3 subunit alpha